MAKFSRRRMLGAAAAGGVIAASASETLGQGTLGQETLGQAQPPSGPALLSGPKLPSFRFRSAP